MLARNNAPATLPTIPDILAIDLSAVGRSSLFRQAMMAGCRGSPTVAPRKALPGPVRCTVFVWGLNSVSDNATSSGITNTIPPFILSALGKSLFKNVSCFVLMHP